MAEKYTKLAKPEDEHLAVCPYNVAENLSPKCIYVSFQGCNIQLEGAGFPGDFFGNPIFNWNLHRFSHR